MSIRTMKEAVEHFGHHIDIAWYGPVDDPISVTIECLDCSAVLVEFSTESTESDDAYRERVLEAMPEGHWYTAEDLGNAYGEEIDAIGAKYGITRN
jgi:hypothetical protein